MPFLGSKYAQTAPPLAVTLLQDPKAFPKPARLDLTKGLNMSILYDTIRYDRRD